LNNPDQIPTPPAKDRLAAIRTTFKGTESTSKPVSKRANLASFGAFWIVVAGFTGHQLLAFYEVISPSVGGIFTTVSLFSILLSFFSMFGQRDFRVLRRSSVFKSFLGFTLLLVIVTAVGKLNTADPNILKSSLSAVIKFVAVFLISLNLDINSPFFSKFCAGFLGLTALAVGTQPSNAISSRYIQVADTSQYFQVNYQTLAALILIVLLCNIESKNRARLFFIFGTSVVILFQLGARFEFGAGLLVIAISEALRVRKSKALWLLVWAVGVLVAIFSLLERAGTSALWQGGSRITSVLSLSSDGSWVERQQLSLNALNTVLRNPLFGRYGSYPPGQYAHNLLSAWVDLSFLGFCLPIFILTRSAFATFSLVKRLPSASNSRTVFCSTVATIIAFLIAKDYTYILFPFSVGLYCRLTCFRWKEATPTSLGTLYLSKKR
jgi:hypothetical protein